MVNLEIDKKAISRFEERRTVYAQKALELLGFSDDDDAPLYCIPVLNEIEIPLTIAAFAKDRDFSPPVNFVIHVDEHDPVIPAGRYAKLLSSYLMDSSSFRELGFLWHNVIKSRIAEYRNPVDLRYTNIDYRDSIRDGAEFFIRCLVFHGIRHDDELERLRPFLDAADILESELDIEA